MSAYHDAVKRFLSSVNKFINVTLQSEILSIPAVRERNKLTELLQKLYSDHDSLAPSSGDEGSTSSARDQNSSQDESRNTFDSSHGSEDDSYSDNIPDTTVKALTNTTKIGYLDKRQKDLLRTTWQKRYCVIDQNIMYTFKKPGDKKQQGAFFLTDYEVREAPQNVKDAAKKESSFEIVCPGKKSYQFLADNKEDLQSWKAAVAAASGKKEATLVAENGDDVYEPLDELAITPSTNMPHVGNDADGMLYDEGTSVAQTTRVSPPSIPPISPPKKDVKVDLNQNVKNNTKAEDFEDDDMIYEPIDVDTPSPIPTTPKKLDKLPSPTTVTPPALPPLSSRQVNPETTSSPAPPPLPVRGEDTGPPPALPNRTALPPPPKNPLPAIPQTPNKKTTPALGKILTPSEDFENMFYGVWNCKGTSDDELTFKRGDVVHVISRDLEKDSWWVGELDGKIGLVPKSYLTPAYEMVP